MPPSRWGRRDCEHHLECLRDADRRRRPAGCDDAGGPWHGATLSVTYYGHLFDASGYGQAARGYIHALHAPASRLSAVDLLNHGRQVRDELVESLVDRPLEPDFHLFHGIPPQWARLAFPLRNAIGMTVWETDTMPTQWRNVLSHVMEVWLPCEFNVSVFRRDLRTPIFKLPHAVIAAPPNGDAHDDDGRLGTAPGRLRLLQHLRVAGPQGPS